MDINHSLHLFAQEDWNLIPWPDTPEGQGMRYYFEPMLKEGTKAFINNVNTKLYILHLDDLFIPICFNYEEYQNASVCSLYSFFIRLQEELGRHRKYYWIKMFTSPGLWAIKHFFRLSRINQVVNINNFLLHTNLCGALSLSDDQIKDIYQLLQIKFPNHTIIFRSLNPYSEHKLINSLKLLKNEFITIRPVYIFDPSIYSSLSAKKRNIMDSDRKLFQNTKIEVLQHSDFKVEDAERVMQLYNMLYLEKYSYCHPQFNIRFFEHIITHKTLLELRGLRYDGILVGMLVHFKRKWIMTAPLVGYDTNLPSSLGLYRMLMSLLTEESLSSGTVFHQSSGVGFFKCQRGTFQEIETTAVFFAHLPWYRQIVWKIWVLIGRRIVDPLFRKYKP